jgi:hypothetical protein
MDDIPKFDPSKAAIEDFDPEFASPAQWARLYRRHGMQVVPARMFSEVSQGKSWKCPLFNSWAELQEELVTDEKFNEWYGPGGKYISRLNMGVITGHASGNLLVIDLTITRLQPLPRGGPAALPSTITAWIWKRSNSAQVAVADRSCSGRRRAGSARPTAPDRRRHPRPGWVRDLDRVHQPRAHDRRTEVEGRSPQDIEIMMAPDWLLDEVTKLVVEHGGGGGGEGINGRGGRQRTASPGSAPKGGSDYDAFGNKCDGREAYMRDLVWGAIVDWYRECPIKPGIEDQQKKAEEKYLVYESGVVPRTIDASLTKTQLLDKEGRGPEAFWDKWQYAMRRWNTKVAEEAAKLKPGAGQGTQQAPPQSERHGRCGRQRRAGCTHELRRILAIVFIDRHEVDLRFVAKWGQWFHWDGSRWLEETLCAFDCASDLPRSRQRRTGANTAVSPAPRPLPPSGRWPADARATFEQWDTDPDKFNTHEEE